MNYYEIYDWNGTNLLAKGNARECQQQLGLAALSGFYILVRNVLRGKNRKYIVIKKNGADTDYPVLGENDPMYEQYMAKQIKGEDDDATD